MKRKVIGAVGLMLAMCVLALMTARDAVAQLAPFESIVVGESAGGGAIGNPGHCSSRIVCAQEFAIGPGGAYVNRLVMGLDEYQCYGVTGGYESTQTFTMWITKNVFYDYDSHSVSYGPIFLYRIESLTFNLGGTAFGHATFSDTFPQIWLPPDVYYLVMVPGPNDPDFGPSIVGNPDGPPNCSAQPSAIDWELARYPATEVGNLGAAWAFEEFTDSGYTKSSCGQDPVIRVFCDEYGYPDDSGFMAFDLEGPVILFPVGAAKFEKTRLGMMMEAPGGPVQAQVGFLNAETGSLLGPLRPVTLNPGQLESVDLDLTPYVARLGQRIEVQPVIEPTPGAADPGPMQISATEQTFDDLTGFQAVSATVPQPGAFGSINPGPQNLPGGVNPGPISVSALSPQILAGAQTMRFDIVALPFDSCTAQVSFNDGNGVALIPAVPVNLTPGTGTTVDLTSEAVSVRLGQNIEVQPVLTPTAPLAAVAQNSVCIGSVEVFDQVTGRSWSHQNTMVGLPAVQLPAGGTPGTPGVPATAAGTQ